MALQTGRSQRGDPAHCRAATPPGEGTLAMGAMTRAEYRGLAQAQQRLIIERLQETAEAMNSLFPWEVRVAVCRKCRVPAIVEVQESEREVTPYWQRADD